MIGAGFLLLWLSGNASAVAFVSMRAKTNTALSITALSLALIGYHARVRNRRLLYAVTALPVAIGLVTLLQYLSGVNLGIDEHHGLASPQ